MPSKSGGHPIAPRPYLGDTAVLATMHGKERVIAPILEHALGLRIRVTMDIDTDRFGTFSRDVARTGSQLDAARAKICAAFDLSPQVQVAIASEGSFGPHPDIPFVPLDRELVVFHDRVSGLELIGHHASLLTNLSHAVVSDMAAAFSFAERVQFPAHGLIVMGCVDEQPAPDRALIKNTCDLVDLGRAVEQVIRICGVAYIETDMRAHRNPTRMRVIKRATLDLVRRFRSRCPNCARPGFVVSERIVGLPCSWCERPTSAIRAEVSSCADCGHRVEQVVNTRTADPGECADCNP